jgi:hypothetical protein
MEVLRTLKVSLEEVEKKISKAEPALDTLKRERERLLTTIDTLEEHSPSKAPAALPSSKGRFKPGPELGLAVLSAVRSGADTLPRVRELIGSHVPESVVRSALLKLVKEGELVTLEKASGRKPTRYGTELEQAA